MAKEIKNFKVWHPPDQSPGPEPLIEMPVSEYIPSIFLRPRLTLTGYLWVIAPWALFLKTKLSYTLAELMIWIAAWSASSGAVSLMLKKTDCKGPYFAAGLYAVFHVHCMIFSAVLYGSRPTQSAAGRVWQVLALQLLASALFTTVSLTVLR